MIGEDAFRRVNDPVEVDGQRASALRFADPHGAGALARCWCFIFCLGVFPTANFATTGLPCWEKQPQSITPGQMTYHLRRLRLHGIIARVPKSHRYRLTEQGWRTIPFCTRSYNRLLRPRSCPACSRRSDARHDAAPTIRSA
jgi:Predicted transcriptional regulators